MTHDPAALYSILAARDPRFDGVFYVGVTSTGIYCRPVCTAKTPKAANCRFFDSPAAAEKARFRPCLRCRPELAPGSAPVDDARRIAALIAQRIDEGMPDAGGGLETLAAKFGWSARQIRRIVQKELGVSPIELVLSRRLLIAKQLLTDTRLPIAEIAFASGFGSLRRFNDAFGTRYGMPPTRFRLTSVGHPAAGTPSPSLALQLAYRPPLAWAALLDFLRSRAMRGVEVVTDTTYMRSVQIGPHVGWVQVSDMPDRHALRVELSHTLTPVLPAVLGRLRQLFDLNARPDVIAERLAPDPVLAEGVARSPGLRVPGAFDGFELVVRAILSQQISVKAATTLGGRFAEQFGERIETPHAGLDRLSPAAGRIAAASVDEVATIGLVRTRAASIVALAQEVASGRLALEPGADPERVVGQLVASPGIGPWTAQYIAMRALRWPDAFPKEDIALRKRLGGLSPSAAEHRSLAWRPWRSYATMHLWSGASVG